MVFPFGYEDKQHNYEKQGQGQVKGKVVSLALGLGSGQQWMAALAVVQQRLLLTAYCSRAVVG